MDDPLGDLHALAHALRVGGERAGIGRIEPDRPERVFGGLRRLAEPVQLRGEGDELARGEPLEDVLLLGDEPIERVTKRSARGSRPRTRTVPFEGLARPHSILNIVDLPAPFGPRSAVTPGPRRATSETATSAPNHFDTPSATTRGSCWRAHRKASIRRYRSQQTRSAAAPSRAGRPRRGPSRARGSAPRCRRTLAEDPVRESAATNGKLSRSSSFGASALSIAVRTTNTGTKSRSTVATAAAARRVVSSRPQARATSTGARSRGRWRGSSGGGRASPRGRRVAGEHEREEHEEERADGDQEHDPEHRMPCDEIARAVERACEVQAEHPRAPVGAERLGRDERGEERERGCR